LNGEDDCRPADHFISRKDGCHWQGTGHSAYSRQSIAESRMNRLYLAEKGLWVHTHLKHLARLSVSRAAYTGRLRFTIRGQPQRADRLLRSLLTQVLPAHILPIRHLAQ